jgi:hypothetical protein
MQLMIADKTNQNLISAQKELLTWHWQLGHMSMDQLQQLFVPKAYVDTTYSTSDSCLFAKNASMLETKCQPSKCVACELTKAKRRSPNVSTSQRTRPDVLATGHLCPGQKVSVDQYESSLRG